MKFASLRAMRTSGYTLVELLVAVGIILILAAIAVPVYRQHRERAYDAAAKTDLRNAMMAIEAAIVGDNSLPGSPEELAQYGHRLSQGVSFTRYSVGTKNGVSSVHMHVEHQGSSNAWHANYPGEGVNIEIR